MIDVVLWLIVAMGGLVAALLLAVLGRRGIAVYFDQRLARRIRNVERIIDEHARRDYVAVDRLLFQLGEVQDPQAIEAALNEQLEKSGQTQVPQLRKLYESLGLVQKYLDCLHRSPRWVDRASAARALGQLEVVEAIPQLVAAMRDAHEDAGTVKLAAAQALGQMRAEAAIPSLLEQLEQADDWASPRLAELLVAFGETALGPLHRALASSQTNGRAWAAQALGRIGHASSVPLLIGCLRDRADRVRLSAAEALGRIGDARAANDLVQTAMRDPVPPVRAESARALGSIGQQTVLEHLVLLLSDHDYWTRLRAVEAIEMLRPRDYTAVERALDDDSPAVRERAAAALERIGALQQRVVELISDDRGVVARAMASLVRVGRAGAVQSLFAQLDHADFRVRARICEALGESGDPSCAVEVKRALQDPEWPVRARAVEALARLRAPETVDWLVPALSDSEETVRVAVVTALHRLGVSDDRGHVDAIVQLFHEGNAEVRCSAIEVIGQHQLPAVPELLKGALHDPNSDVRLAAIKAMSRRAGAEFAQPMIDSLSDPDHRVRAEAAAGLGRLPTDDALVAVADQLSTEDPRFRETLTDILAREGVDGVLAVAGAPTTAEGRLALAWALGKTTDPAALDPLLDLGQDKDARLRAAVAGALSKIGGERAEAALLGLLRDPNERVRAAAVNALGSVGTPRCSEQLINALDDPDRFVRNRVPLALGRIGGPLALAGLEYALNRQEGDLSARANVVIGYGLLGGELGFKVALSALADARLHAHISERLREEPDDVGRCFRENLHLAPVEGGPCGEGIDVDALARRYADELRNGQRPEGRLAALEALQALGAEQHLDLLLTAVRTDPEPEVRRRAVAALGPWIDRRGVVDTLLLALRDPVLSVQIAAVEGLGATRDPRHNHALLSRFSAGDEELTAATVTTLAAANAARVADFVDELMGHRDEAVMRGGAAVLGEIADPLACGLLLAWLETRSAPMRIAVLTALGRIGTVAAKEALIGSLADPKQAVRLAAATALARLPGTVDALARLCHDPALEVRLQLARHVGVSASVPGMRIAETLADDPEEDVRLEAMRSLLLLNDDGATRRFNELFDAQLAGVVNRLRALDHTDPALLSTCDMAGAAKRAEARVAALQALSRLRQRPAELLVRTMSDPDPAVRVAAIEASRGSTDRAVHAALDQLLRDPDPAVRDAVRRGRMAIVDGA